MILRRIIGEGQIQRRLITPPLRLTGDERTLLAYQLDDTSVHDVGSPCTHCWIECALALGCRQATSSLAQNLHFVAATGSPAERQFGQALEGAASPNTEVPRRCMYERYGTTMAK